MKKKRGILFGVVFICVLFFVIVFFVRNKESAEPVSKSDFKLNTVVTVTIYDLEEKEKKPDDKDKRNEKGIHREEKDAEEIIDKALKLCDKYEKIFSRTLPESEIYALNHGTLPMEDGYYLLSEECAALIEKGLYYSELSGGAFDITIEPVSSLWDFTSDILLNFIVPVPIFIEFAIDISFILYPSIKCCLSIFISLLVKIFFKSSKANCSSYATASYVSNSHSGIGVSHIFIFFFMYK